MTSFNPRARKIYHGESLRAVAMPLGGIGAGTIALCGDGSLRQWQIHNQINHLACIPHSFFAIWTHPDRSSEPPVARVLQSSALYDSEVVAPPTSNDHVVPLPHRQLLKKLPGVPSTEFIGEYPIAELRYHDPALPIEVHMEAFSPFIPLDSKNSGLPAILFNLTVTNPTAHIIHTGLLATMQNAVGWDGATPIFGNRSFCYGGNSNSLARLDGMTAINMSTTRLPEDDDGYGSMTLAALAPDATCLPQWGDLSALWDDFADGNLSNIADSTPSPAGRTWNGALAQRMALEPGESRTVAFIIAWHFPNRYVNYAQDWLGIQDSKSKFWLGNQYNNWFHSALDVAAYVKGNFDYLATQTRLARDTFYDTMLPYALIDAVTSQMSIIRSPTCFWAEDGRFFGFEGCCGASTTHSGSVGGCCPLNCTHVWNYEMALARLFPALERTMRETEWNVQQHPTGYLPHRVVVPLYLPRAWDREIGGPRHPALDGLLGAILKTYREYRACGDSEWLAGVWHSVKQALGYIWAKHDANRAGVIEGEQPNTFDCSIYGANTFIGTLYLAALRATEVMANQRDDAEFAAECRAAYARGRTALEKRLWNGEYYIQDVDLNQFPELNWGTGCHSDQLLGQWWAYVLGLGDLLDHDHIRMAASSIMRYNLRGNFRAFEQKPRAFVTEDDQGLLVCTWPRGGRPAKPTLYSDEVWTGIEYEVAALLLYLGETDAALHVVAATRKRYDGRKQNPWNDIECGDHYVRAMSSWALLEAASGYSYDASVAEIGFAPNLTPHDYRAPFVACDGWGTFSQEAQDGEQVELLSLAYGSLAIKTLRFAVHNTVQTVVVSVDGQPVEATCSQSGDKVSVILSKAITLQHGSALTARLSNQD
ncbi:MAG: hypothetical protein HY782_05095 [Chloroflexi bacterium]|nr:hypothetical protein [Chloroflexota bacterium]